MPVEAAVEDRVQLRWAARVFRAGQDVVQPVGVFASDVSKGDRGGSLSEIRRHRGRTREHMRTVFPIGGSETFEPDPDNFIAVEELQRGD
jgi:hypothetical protein